MNVEQAVPMLGVRDMAASLRFYVDGLGFTRTRQWIDEGVLRWCWLEMDGAAVMLQMFWTDGHHRNVPDTPVGLGMSINFICRDAITLYRAFTTRGVKASVPFVGNGMWVTGVDDPDGYMLFFESPTEVPEETVWSPAG